MGLIKALRDLKEEEIIRVQQYINCLEKTEKSVDEIQKELNTKVYNYGEGILFYFNQNGVIASIRVVLEVVKHLSVVYLHQLTIAEDTSEELSVISELILAGINIGKQKNSEKILFGIRDERVLEIASRLGYRSSYKAYKMKLENRKIADEPLEVVRLSQENKELYLSLFNASFSDMPHGCYYEMDNIEQYLDDKSGNEYYLVKVENAFIGFMNLEIDDNVGSFDIGLCKEYRGRGYGKRLLETAIYSLNELKVDKVTLTVIEKNSIALGMYLNRGFVIDNILSHWIQIKI